MNSLVKQISFFTVFVTYVAVTGTVTGDHSTITSISVLLTSVISELLCLFVVRSFHFVSSGTNSIAYLLSCNLFSSQFIA